MQYRSKERVTAHKYEPNAKTFWLILSPFFVSKRAVEDWFNYGADGRINRRTIYRIVELPPHGWCLQVATVETVAHRYIMRKDDWIVIKSDGKIVVMPHDQFVAEYELELEHGREDKTNVS